MFRRQGGVALTNEFCVRARKVAYVGMIASWSLRVGVVATLVCLSLRVCQVGRGSGGSEVKIEVFRMTGAIMDSSDLGRRGTYVLLVALGRGDIV